MPSSVCNELLCALDRDVLVTPCERPKQLGSSWADRCSSTQGSAGILKGRARNSSFFEGCCFILLLLAFSSARSLLWLRWVGEVPEECGGTQAQTQQFAFFSQAMPPSLNKAHTNSSQTASGSGAEKGHAAQVLLQLENNQTKPNDTTFAFQA